jgi:hypothetical protein
MYQAGIEPTVTRSHGHHLTIAPRWHHIDSITITLRVSQCSGILFYFILFCHQLCNYHYQHTQQQQPTATTTTTNNGDNDVAMTTATS